MRAVLYAERRRSFYEVGGGLLHESAVWTTDRAMGGESLSCGAYRKGDGCMPPAGTNGHTMVSGLLSEIK